MKKQIFIILFLLVILSFGIQIFADSATKCADEYEYQIVKIKDVIYDTGAVQYKNVKLCHNKKTNISYYPSKKPGIIMAEFYRNGEPCGYDCDYSGKNCHIGYCQISDCKTEEGYTQIKYIKGKYSYESVCYNPSTKIAYTGNTYYLNDKYCGFKCDYSGNNCKEGYCNAPSCNDSKGYTEIKQIDNQYGCYNPENHMFYTTDKYKNKSFYYEGKQCGTNCDDDGKNCKTGICSILTCKNSEKYKEINNGKCYNPQTKISYEGKNYYVNDKICGSNCDDNGRNCEKGACFADECLKKYGYPQIKDGKCYNPQTLLSIGIEKDFYYKSAQCGINCDLNGRNCQVSFGIKGICNIDDCPVGYKQIVSREKKGMCRKENDNNWFVLYADGNNKFHSYTGKVIKENLNDNVRSAKCFSMPWLEDCR